MHLHRIKALGPWLSEAKYVWLAAGVNLAALVVALRPGSSEPAIRLTGLALQLLGIATVIWGIAETRALFGHPPLLFRARGWLKRFPLRSRNIVLTAEGIASATAFGRMHAYVTHGPVGERTPEARLEALEKNIGSIHERISELQKENESELHKVGESLSGESAERRREDEGIRKKLEATGTGGVHISAIGASWLFVGVVLSTAAPEIAALLK
jgi:hypothetical protein